MDGEKKNMIKKKKSLNVAR